MKILVIGSGGREHALCWRLRKDGHELYALPGSAGMSDVAICIAGAPEDQEGVVAAASANAADLIVIGPEVPLVDGLADRLRAAGLTVFGPSAQAAQLEGSKSFSKEFFARHGIRSARFYECRDMQAAEQAIAALGDRVVVKADGLAAGKGVVVCSSAEEARQAAREMLEEGRFAAAGTTIVIETRLEGREVSLMAICDGQRYELLAPAEDHKAIFDGDMGPNTGGMGAVSPPAWVDDDLIERARNEIFDLTLQGLNADGLDFRGVLYAGLMVDAEGTPWLLEYNVRFGDPETEPIMMRVIGDLGVYLLGAAMGRMPDAHLGWDPRTAICVILASDGYPVRSSKGDRISGLEATRDAIVVFHAGTEKQGGSFATNGGRVLAVTGLGESLAEARRMTYAAVEKIQFRGMQYRRDIGQRGEEHD